MSEWISVKDRLPDKDEQNNVLLWDGKEITCGYYFEEVEHYFEDGILLGNYGIMQGFMCCCEDKEICDMPAGESRFTHWMPLPPPPISKD